MRKILPILGIALAMAIVAPVFADLTGYVPAPYPSSWAFAPNYPWEKQAVEVGSRWVLRPTVTNVGAFDLSDAQIKIVITKVWIWDGTVWTGPFTDAATIDANVQVLNGEVIGPKTYTVSLGTLRIDRSKDALFNVWAGEGISFTFVVSLWYLP